MLEACATVQSSTIKAKLSVLPPCCCPCSFASTTYFREPCALFEYCGGDVFSWQHRCCGSSSLTACPENLDGPLPGSATRVDFDDEQPISHTERHGACTAANARRVPNVDSEANRTPPFDHRKNSALRRLKLGRTCRDAAHSAEYQAVASFRKVSESGLCRQRSECNVSALMSTAGRVRGMPGNGIVQMFSY